MDQGRTYGFVSTAKSVTRLVVSMGLYYTGAIRLYEMMRRHPDGSIMILGYHDINDSGYLNLSIPEPVFRRHVEYLLKNGYRIISLDEAVSALKSGGPLPGRTVVITFDDGYRSMYTSVLPLVKEYGIPVTVFASIRPIEKMFPLFVDALIHALDNTRARSLDMTGHGLDNYPIATRSQREKAIFEINEHAKGATNDERDALIDSIFALLGVDRNSHGVRNMMLSWDEVVEMSRHKVSFGAHTITHPVLSRIPIEDAEMEVKLSRDALFAKLGAMPTLFAYPYGTNEDYNRDVARVVERNGFICACTLEHGENRAGADLFSLKRTMVVSDIPVKGLRVFSNALFAAQLSGITGWLRPWRRGRANEPHRGPGHSRYGHDISQAARR